MALIKENVGFFNNDGEEGVAFVHDTNHDYTGRTLHSWRHQGVEVAKMLSDGSIVGGTSVFDVRYYGAKGDGVTDDTAAIQRALDAAYDAGGGTVTVPTGTYLVSATLFVGDEVVMRGASRGSVIKASSSFPQSSSDAVVVLGDDADTFVFGCRLEDIFIDCNERAYVGVYSSKANENAGLVRVSVDDPLLYNVWFETSSAQNWLLKDLELIQNAGTLQANPALLKIEGGASNPRGVDGITCFGKGPTEGQAGIMIDACPALVISRYHYEGIQDGILIGDTTECQAVVIMGVNGPSGGLTAGGNCIRVEDCVNYVLLGVRKGVSTNAVLDNDNSVTVTDSYIPFLMIPRTYDIDGGTIDGTPIGGTTPAVGTFTTISQSGRHRWTADNSLSGTDPQIVRTAASGLAVQGGTGSVYDYNLARNTDASSIVNVPTGTRRWMHERQMGHVRRAFGADDATPSVADGTYFVTANANPTTVTDFDDGFTGQEIVVEINDTNTTLDFTSSGLKGNGGSNWTPTTGDHMRCIYNGTDWLCEVSDNTA